MFIALRYLAASRKNAHVAAVSAISVAGLALGVAALVVSLALLTGFQDKIRERLAKTTPHLRVSPARGEFFDDPSAVAAALARDARVLSVSPLVEGRGWLSDPRGRTTLPVRFQARKDGPAPGYAILSSAVSGQLGAGSGSPLRLVSGKTTLSPLGPVPSILPVRVERVSREAGADRGPEVTIALSDGEALVSEPGAISSFEVRLKSAEEAQAAGRSIGRELSGSAVVKTWSQLNTGLNFALRMEKALIFVTVSLIVLVASLNVVSDLSLLVVEKRRDLGILATLGAGGERLSKIYWWLAAAIGLLGTLSGAAAGALLSSVLDRYGLVPLPSDVYLLDHVPFALHARDLASILLFSLAAVAGAAVFPALSASRVGPAEALRLSR